MPKNFSIGGHEWYVKDATGNTIATYIKQSGINNAHLSTKGFNKYGSSLLGTEKKVIDVEEPAPNNDVTVFVRGETEYLLSDHRSNNMAAITDKKLQHSTDGSIIDYYLASITTSSYYSAYGAISKSWNGDGIDVAHNGQKRSPEISPTAQTAEFWEYDGDVARRWNVDPKLNTSFSGYNCFAGNPVLYFDPHGDTTAVYARTKDAQGQDEFKLLYQTYGKGRNKVIILDPKHSAKAISQIKQYKAAQKIIDKNKDNDAFQQELEMEDLDQSSNHNLIYDIQSIEKFQNDYWNKGNITTVASGVIEDAFDIKIENQSVTLPELKNYIKSLGVGPEYIASLVLQDGIYVVGSDVINNADLVRGPTNDRKVTVHLHPPVLLKRITFKWVYRFNNTILEADTGPTIPKNNGMDAHDHGEASSDEPSAMVDGLKVYIYGRAFGETIIFNRKTKKYE